MTSEQRIKELESVLDEVIALLPNLVGSSSKFNTPKFQLQAKLEKMK